MRSTLALLALAFAAGCDAPRPIAPAPATAPRPALPPGLGAGAWADHDSRRFDARVPLPDGRAWRIDDRTESWLVATHPPTGSELAVRVWGVTGGTATRPRCEEEARLRRPLPTREGADIVERRAIDAPHGFDTVVEAGIISPLAPRPLRPRSAIAPAQPTPPAPLRGFVLAFGGRGRRCFAYAFTTAAPGPGAEPIVGERLAAMTQALAGVTVESDLAPTIDRRPAR